MKNFALLFEELDQTNKTNEKVRVLKEYFQRVSDEDKIHAIALFTGRKPKRAVNSTQLRSWAQEISGIPAWLFDESYSVVGDLAETIALLIPETPERNERSLEEWIVFIHELSKYDEFGKRELILEAWKGLSTQERFVFNKLMTGGFRVGVSQNLLIKALSEMTNIESPVLAHRLMGNWSPFHFSFEQLVQEEHSLEDISRPYPFFLAYAIDETQSLDQTLGEPAEWQAEWKWDGIRGQLIIRSGELFLWSRGEELVSDKFPELMPLRSFLPEGIVADGEIMCFREEQPMPFQNLQTRIGRKNLNKKILSDNPVIFMAYDLLEYEGKDIRDQPLEYRRSLLEKLAQRVENLQVFRLSKRVDFESWEDLAAKRAEARENFAEGFMLKRRSSPYLTGRKRGDWWKWKVDPLSIDAVLIYAQKGHGRRADLFTDYTFAVWDGDKLVSFAKAYSGLTDKEIREVDRIIRKNTIEKFGPVRTVKPTMVFEIGFEGINKSTRHKSGVALRFPRILRWRTDKAIEEADTLETLKSFIDQYHKKDR